jgi:hypothetical protein
VFHNLTRRAVMTDINAEQLKVAVERQHGGIATFVGWMPVKEMSDGKPVWEGNVAVFNFDGKGGPNATRTYAWLSSIPGTSNGKFFSVLHMGPVRSPQDAFDAVMEAEHPAGRPTAGRA